MSGKLENKVAVITGGSNGIGLATARLFAEQGAKVVITGRRPAALDQAVATIGHGALGLVSDASSLSDLEQLFSTVHARLGRIDVLVANAAMYALAPLAAISEETFDALTVTNYKGTFFTVQKALPYLNDGASVILTSSTVATKGVPNHAAYAASKAAVRSLARSFSAELLDRRIRVNVLTPGPIDTQIFAQVADSPAAAAAIRDSMGQFAPAKRVGTPEEAAAASLYLASPESAFMLGSELVLDGGISAL